MLLSVPYTLDALYLQECTVKETWTGCVERYIHAVVCINPRMQMPAGSSHSISSTPVALGAAWFPAYPVMYLRAYRKPKRICSRLRIQQAYEWKSIEHKVRP